MEIIFWWTIFPYICGTILVIATFYRLFFAEKAGQPLRRKFLKRSG